LKKREGYADVNCKQPPFRRLPPYGKALLESRFKGLAPRDLFVCLDDWRAFKGRARIVIPPDTNPAELDLRFAAGVDCIVAWLPQSTGQDRMLATVRALIAHEARRVWVLNREAPHHSFFAKSVQRGVELPEQPETLDAVAA
jgi:hypothetical protein